MQSISVLIPVYKNPEQLRETLASLTKCNTCFTEIIIGDDGGGKEVEEVIREFRKMTIPLHHLLPEGSGCLPLNIMRMTKAATGEWLYLLHSDDRWVGLSPEASLWFNDPSVDFIFTDHWVISNEGERLEDESLKMTAHYGRDTLRQGVQSEILALGISLKIGLDGFFVRKNCAQNVKVDRKHTKTGDWLWVLKCLENCRKIVYSNERSFEYRLSSLGLTSQGSDRSLTYEMLLDVKARSEIEKDELLKQRCELAASACWDYLLKGEFENARGVIEQKFQPSKGLNRFKLAFFRMILLFSDQGVALLTILICTLYPRQKKRKRDLF